jgi:hypothetical protein
MAQRPGAPTSRTRAGLAITGGLGVLVVAAVALVPWLGAGAQTPPPPTPGPTAVAVANPTSPPSEPSAEPTLSASPSFAVDSLDPTIDPQWTPQAIEPAPIPSGRLPTRVTVAALGIDIPVTRQTTTYPACGVAMYLMEMSQPGSGRVTYLYAHAQAGNFLPLYQASLVNNGARMVGMLVEVYTGDSLKFTYRIVQVRRHVTTLDGAFAWRGESVFLQTSEGQGATATKLQVVGAHVRTEPADYAAAHPAPKPVTCR